MGSLDITAYVLAGGRSSRMGDDKALLLFDGKTLAERMVALAHTISSQVFLSGDKARLQSFGPVVEDIYPDSGPLGGIHAALTSSPTDLNLVLAIDTPFVTPEFLRFLVQCAQDSYAVVTAPRTGTWQPLCAVYRKAFATRAEDALKAGRRRVDALFDIVQVRAIEEPELRRFAFDPGMFDNLNTPLEFERAHERIRKQRIWKQ